MKGFITNAWDRNNLNFLMSCDRESLQDWFDHTGTDDLDYAWELLSAYSRELDAAASELRVEVQLTLRGVDSSVSQLIQSIAK